MFQCCPILAPQQPGHGAEPLWLRPSLSCYKSVLIKTFTMKVCIFTQHETRAYDRSGSTWVESVMHRCLGIGHAIVYMLCGTSD